MDDLTKEKIWEEIRRVALNESDGKREDEKDLREMMILFGCGRDGAKRHIALLMEKGRLTRRKGRFGAWYYRPNSNP